MAPTGSDEFEGDEFANNLFSDLAPLLTLFGEQVTKQFLSMSLGWADHLLLAMGPLGIITIVISTIRLAGSKTLRALVGRARESRSDAEQELLSSTSDEVCEMWSDQGIVRVKGQTNALRTMVVTNRGHAWSLEMAHENKLVSLVTTGTATDVNFEAAPNLALNVSNTEATPRELWTWAAVGVALQAAAVMFPAVASYRLQWFKAESQVADYAYPCFVAGSFLIFAGILGCGHVIEGVTVKTALQFHESRPDCRAVWIQSACTVSDQHFSSCAILQSPNEGQIRMSRFEPRFQQMNISIRKSGKSSSLPYQSGVRLC